VTSRAGNRADGDGFTLLELLVVLVILGLTITLAVPMFTHAMPGVEAKAAARDVAAMMRAAHSLAITGNREVTVAVDLDRRTVELAGARSRTIAKGIGIGLYTAAEELIDRGAGRIRFYPDGTSTGGRVRLSAGERKYDVTVDWISGSVKIDD
jgi:general secretion pathway protein H